MGFERGGRQCPSAEGDRRDEERGRGTRTLFARHAHCRLTPDASTRLCLSRSRPAAGSVACQILDAMYPGEVPMSRGASEGGKRRVGNESVVRSPKGPPPSTTNATVPPPIPLAVRWDARSPHEYIDNYKIIQQVFEKKGIDKYIGACVCHHVDSPLPSSSAVPFPLTHPLAVPPATHAQRSRS